VDGNALLLALAELARRFLVLPKWAAETLALWVLHTYAFHLRDVTTYLGIESPEKRCGKTTLLKVLRRLVNRPVVASNISSPAFFRVIAEAQPALLIDEADTLLYGNDELRGILNAGYARETAYVVRVAPQHVEGLWLRAEREGSGEQFTGQGPEPFVGEGRVGRGQGMRLAQFSCWCPKAIAAIGRLPDTLADRCIVVRMQRKTAQEKCERLRHLDATELRRKCARFVQDHAAEIGAAQPALPPDLNDRAADIWEPLLALADLAGGDWPEKARQAALGLTMAAEENSPIASLLLDIFVAFATAGAERMFSSTLTATLAQATDRPWASLRKGKGVSELLLAKWLRPYGVRPKTMRIDGALAKGYMFEDFSEVFRRYIPRSEVEALKAQIKGELEARDAARQTPPGKPADGQAEAAPGPTGV
jgi:hypothetical protein